MVFGEAVDAILALCHLFEDHVDQKLHHRKGEQLLHHEGDQFFSGSLGVTPLGSAIWLPDVDPVE